MKTAQSERQAMTEQVKQGAPIAGTAGKKTGVLKRSFLRLASVVALVALAAVSLRAEIWLLSKDSRLLAITGLLFFGYLFFASAFGIYYNLFSRTPQQSTGDCS